MFSQNYKFGQNGNLGQNGNGHLVLNVSNPAHNCRCVVLAYS